MRYPFVRSFVRRRQFGNGAFTLLEVLVALAIAMTFLGALYTSFIQMMRTSDENSAQLEALRNGRTAIMIMSDEFKALSASGANFTPTLIAVSAEQTYGDGIDNDDDGRIDEESLNGRDDDADWNAATDDLHAQVATGANPLFERFQYTAKPPFDVMYGVQQDDLGDLHVDEDVKFGNDLIVFRITPLQPVADLLLRQIIYSIGSFDGQQNVLIRQSRTEFTAASGKLPIVSTSPMAFNVLGFDLLFWDPNANPNPGAFRQDRPYWVEKWDSTLAASFKPPKLPLPASIYARVTLYADRTAAESYIPGTPVQTMHVETIVNIEDVIGDLSYPRPII